MNKHPMKKPDLTQSKEAMADRLAAMRQQAGITDRRVLHFTCSATGKGFSISFKRLSPSHRFQIESFVTGQDKGGLLGKLFAVKDEPAQNFAADEFDFAGFACPHCGHKGSHEIANFCQCICDRLLCGARITVMNDVTRFACHDACGNTGILGSTIKNVAGDESAGNAASNLLAGPDGAKRLSGPVKHLPRK
jgi:predicted RNA-binding Zn-ribbon protein involved in translation (DUF1610 family)